MDKKLRVGFFPYGLAQENPYQQLLIQGLTSAHVDVIKIPGRKFFPLLALANKKVDIIHLFWPHDFYMGKNRVTRIFKQISLLLTLFILKKHITVYSAENVTSHHADLMQPEREIIWIKRILKRCRGIIFMSKASAQVFGNYYNITGHIQTVVPHVSYASVYPNTITAIAAKAQLQLQGQFVYLILGRLQPYKGIELSIDAFKQINKPGTSLLIAGKCISKNYLAQLQQHAGDCLGNNIFIEDNYIPNQAIQLYMNGCDCIIINYTDVPLNPGSIAMAKDFSVPVIANRHAVIQEICNDYPYYPFSAGNCSELQEAMLHVLENAMQKPVNKQKSSGNSPEQIGNLLYQYYLKLVQ